MEAPPLSDLCSLWQVVQSLAAMRSRALSEAASPLPAGFVVVADAVVSFGVSAGFWSPEPPQAAMRMAQERAAASCFFILVNAPGWVFRIYPSPMHRLMMGLRPA